MFVCVLGLPLSYFCFGFIPFSLIRLLRAIHTILENVGLQRVVKSKRQANGNLIAFGVIGRIDTVPAAQQRVKWKRY